MMLRFQVYNPRIRTHSVTVQPISRGQARSRRQLTPAAGETLRKKVKMFFVFYKLPSFLSDNAGKCYRLYPENRPLPAETRPHIVDSDITSTVLFLKRMEIAGLRHCHFVDRPGGGAHTRALH